MKVAKLKNVDMHWRIDGNPKGKVVVFANSLGTDLRIWDKVIEMLPSSLCLVRFDKRGHGLSSVPSAPYNMVELVSDVEEFLDAISSKNVVFVGLSIGGMIGQQLAVKRPDLVKALVLSNTAAKIGTPQMWADRIAIAKAGNLATISQSILERWFSPSFRETDEFSAWQRMLEQTSVDGYWGCCAAVSETDFTHHLSDITQPTIGIAGDQDGASPPEIVRESVSKIENSQFKVIQSAGHLPCVEQPAAYARLILRFLKETNHV